MAHATEMTPCALRVDLQTDCSHNLAQYDRVAATVAVDRSEDRFDCCSSHVWRGIGSPRIKRDELLDYLLSFRERTQVRVVRQGLVPVNRRTYYQTSLSCLLKQQ